MAMDNVLHALETTQQVTSDLNKSKCIKLVRDITSWLAPADPWKAQNISCELRHKGTAAWFIRGITFSEWRESSPGSLLWIHGKPGAGKGVLCSAIIQDIDAMRKAGLASLAIFYFDSEEDQRKDRRGLLSSLLVQLCHQSDSYCDILSHFYVEHSNGVKHPSNDALFKCLKDLLRVPAQAPVYMILDALDQCSNTSALPSAREGVLKLLEELINSQFPHLHICVTSRLETDIQRVLTPLAFSTISLHDESGHRDDIDDYIKFVVNTDPMMQRWKVDDRERAIKVLMEHGDGRFGWVHSQLVDIRQFPTRIHGLLHSSSETPNEMYHRTLGDIKEADRDLAHCMLQCVAVASRPLRVEELPEFLSFDFTARPIPRFHQDRHQKADEVLSKCSDLLFIVKVDGSSIIQFLRHSVEEYLASFHLSDISDITSPFCQILKTPAHTRAAQACLGILLHLDNDVTRDSLQKFPLVEHAAEHWIDHARFEYVQQDVKEALKCLFDPRKRHLAVLVWIHDPARLSRRRTERAERPSQPSGTPLHYAALYGLHGIVDFLITEHSAEVDSRGFDDESTPLHVASSRGHVEVARTLLDNGAKAIAQDKHGWTPLHDASFGGHTDLVLTLLDHGADATAQNKLGSTPLLQACRRGHVQVARILLDHGANTKANGKHGWTPLHEASSRGHMELVRTLLKRGADVRSQDVYGWTPHHAASSGGHAEISRILFEYGADAKAQDNPVSLLEALGYGYVDFARILLERGADANARDENGSTLLHNASEEGHTEVVLLLLEHGADETAQDGSGFSPLHSASGNGHVEVTRILLKHGADVAAKAKLSSTPLHDASFGGHVELVRILLERGADAKAHDKQGLTPLHHASGEGHIEIARILLENGADVKAKDMLGYTPLHLALYVGDVELSRMLLDYGADMKARDVGGRTAVEGALPKVLKELQLPPNRPPANPASGMSEAGHCCTM